MHACIYLCVFMYISVFMYVQVHMCLCVCMCLYMYVYMYVSVCACVCFGNGYKTKQGPLFAKSLQPKVLYFLYKSFFLFLHLFQCCTVPSVEEICANSRKSIHVQCTLSTIYLYLFSLLYSRTCPSWSPKGRKYLAFTKEVAGLNWQMVGIGKVTNRLIQVTAKAGPTVLSLVGTFKSD